MSTGRGCFLLGASVIVRAALAVVAVLLAFCIVSYFHCRISPKPTTVVPGIVSHLGSQENAPMIPKPKKRGEASSFPPSSPTPRAVPTGPDSLAAQQRAMARYPALGIPESPLNKAFLERLRRDQTEKPEVFDDPDWPTTIAAEAAHDLQ